MIAHVFARATEARRVDAVLVATDDQRIAEAVDAFGGTAVMTRPDHPSGTDRLAEVASMLSADIIVNLQGDEPLLDPAAVDAAVTPLLEDPGLPLSTLRTPLTDADRDNPNVVKVVVDRTGRAMYFSRSAIPYHRDGAAPAPAWRHLGLYVYRRSALLALAALPPTPLEVSEGLEQLRALEHGYHMHTVVVGSASPSVDTADDLARVRQLLEVSPHA